MKNFFSEELEELVTECDKKILARWAYDVSRRILPLFEKEFPNDKRPRIALQTLQEWIAKGEFHMTVIRKASLDAHAAAREVGGDTPARFAARACGQAVATAHVKTHALGPVYYSIKALRANGATDEEIAKERVWQHQHLIKLKKKQESSPPTPEQG